MSNLDKLKHYIDCMNVVDIFVDADVTQGPLTGQKITIFVSFKEKDGLYYGELRKAFPTSGGGYTVSTDKEIMQLSQFPDYVINEAVQILDKKFEEARNKEITNTNLKEEIRKFVDSVMLRHPELTDEERKQMSSSLKFQINLLLQSTFGRALEFDPDKFVKILREISDEHSSTNQ